MKAPKQTVLLAAFILILAALALLLWVPNDTVSGYIQARRGRVSIGDAMAPGLAFGLMALSGLLILLKAREPETARLTRHDVIFVAALILLVAVFFALMRYTGPLLAALFTEAGDYRVLRDTVPWKHAGFVLGGGGLVAALISWMEGRISLKAALIGLVTTLVLIGVFDLAVDDLLLPPNGDV